jgi:hypothetical protein
MVFRPDEHDVQDFNHTNPVDPVEYLVEIIGEAAARVGTESREKYPSDSLASSRWDTKPACSRLRCS